MRTKNTTLILIIFSLIQNPVHAQDYTVRVINKTGHSVFLSGITVSPHPGDDESPTNTSCTNSNPGQNVVFGNGDKANVIPIIHQDQKNSVVIPCYADVRQNATWRKRVSLEFVCSDGEIAQQRGDGKYILENFSSDDEVAGKATVVNFRRNGNYIKGGSRKIHTKLLASDC